MTLSERQAEDILVAIASANRRDDMPRSDRWLRFHIMGDPIVLADMIEWFEQQNSPTDDTGEGGFAWPTLTCPDDPHRICALIDQVASECAARSITLFEVEMEGSHDVPTSPHECLIEFPQHA